MRSVGCELALDYASGRATLTRLDTGEVVVERDMSEEEKQMNLDFDTD